MIVLPVPPPPNKLPGSPLPCSLMSRVHPMPTAPSSFQLMMSDALDAYKGHTRKDLFAHPLAAQLQTCDSPREILLLLHRQIQALNQSRSTHQRLTRLLDPTVNVLYAFAMVLGEGISPVCFKTCFRLRSASSYSLLGRFSHLRRRSLQELAYSF